MWKLTVLSPQYFASRNILNSEITQLTPLLVTANKVLSLYDYDKVLSPYDYDIVLSPYDYDIVVSPHDYDSKLL